jgi:hypothetical protein
MSEELKDGQCPKCGEPLNYGNDEIQEPFRRFRVYCQDPLCAWEGYQWDAQIFTGYTEEDEDGKVKSSWTTDKWLKMQAAEELLTVCERVLPFFQVDDGDVQEVTYKRADFESIYENLWKVIGVDQTNQLRQMSQNIKAAIKKARGGE